MGMGMFVRMRRLVEMSTYAASRVGLRSGGGELDAVLLRALLGTTSGLPVPKPSFHLLETKIRGCVDDAESGAGTRSNGGSSET